ncbi:hypothetical protein M2437_005241 [Methylorubrum pseudosasae]|nr:hypothetical protein [Methylorubrum pseudosasae]
MQHHAADHLHIEVALAEHALGRLAHRGEGGHQQVVEAGAGRELVAERLRAGAQLIVGKGADFRFEGIDGRDAWAKTLDAAVVGRAENLLGEGTEHREPAVVRSSRAAVSGATGLCWAGL